MENVLYDVVTLFNCMQDPATLAWLSHLDIPLPGEVPSGRYPAPAEIKQVLDNIPAISVSYRISDTSWEASIVSKIDINWAILRVSDYSGNAEVPHHFCFLAGWDETVLQVTSCLVKRCGSLVLLPDSGGYPQVVY